MEAIPIVDVVLAQAPAEGAPVAVPETLPAPEVSLGALPDFGFWSAVTGAGAVEQLVMVLLLAFSVVSWAIIFYKWRTLRRAFAESESFLDVFWESKRLDAIFQKAERLGGSPVSQVFRAGYIELAKLKKKKKADTEGPAEETHLGSLESIERSMRRAQSTELTSLEALVPFLATVGSTSPFIGLFGTVVGIMTSFQDIGRMGNANLATVAPGIGGALVATAFGLFAAIPAVIAYNYLLTRIRILDTEMNNFSSDFLNIVKRHFF